MNSGDNEIQWVSDLKYLGVHFKAARALDVNITPIKHKFYGAFNSLMSRCKYAAEPVNRPRSRIRRSLFGRLVKIFGGGRLIRLSRKFFRRWRLKNNFGAAAAAASRQFKTSDRS
jgi:hypothetical protein